MWENTFIEGLFGKFSNVRYPHPSHFSAQGKTLQGLVKGEKCHMVVFVVVTCVFKPHFVERV